MRFSRPRGSRTASGIPLDDDDDGGPQIQGESDEQIEWQFSDGDDRSWHSTTNAAACPQLAKADAATKVA
jgi:hypothetical protein